jgi:hypothetical protein
LGTKIKPASEKRNLACINENRSKYIILIGKPQKKRKLRHKHLNGNIILKWLLEKHTNIENDIYKMADYAFNDRYSRPGYLFLSHFMHRHGFEDTYKRGTIILIEKHCVNAWTGLD